MRSLTIVSERVTIRGVPSNGLKINGEALRAIRERTGYTGTQLAGIVGINRAYLSHIEAGRRDPSPDVAKRIAEALRCPLAALLLGCAEVA